MVDGAAPNEAARRFYTLVRNAKDCDSVTQDRAAIEPSKAMPSQEYLRDGFNYDRYSGELTWKWRPLEHFVEENHAAVWNVQNASDVAGWTKPPGRNIGRGFIRVSIGGFEFRAHRVIWKWMTGYEPELVAHKNRNGTDNRWDNLTANPRCLHGLRSTAKGVYPRGGKFRAVISVGGRRVCLGTHATQELAEAAYRQAVSEQERGARDAG